MGMIAIASIAVRRSDKTRAVVRFLISRSGIPLISWDGIGNKIDAPPPFGFVISTDGAAWRFFQYVKELPSEGIHAAIRYDAHIDGVNNAVVGMSLETFATLLESHYNTVRDRVQTFTEGD